MPVSGLVNGKPKAPLRHRMFFCLNHLLQDETDGIGEEEEGFARLRYRPPVLSTDAESVHAAQGQA